MNVYEFWIICTIPTTIYGIGLEFHGIIDLGSTLKFKYNLSRPEIILESESDENEEKGIKKHKKLYKPQEECETFEAKPLLFNDANKNVHLDKDEVKRFIQHIRRVSLKLLENFINMMKLPAKESKHKAKKIKAAFTEMFESSLNRTKHKLRSHSGSEKVLNIVHNSNRILRILTGAIRNKKYDSKFLKKIDKLKNIEEAHVCTQFQICRKDAGFVDFIVDVITILLLSDEDKMLNATKTAMLMLNNTDLTTALTNETQVKLREVLTRTQNWGPFQTRAFLLVLRSVLSDREVPIYIKKDNLELKIISNHTVILRELLNIFDRILFKSDHIDNWNKVLLALQDWASGDDEDITEKLKMFVKYFEDIADESDDGTAKEIDKFMRYLLKVKK